MILCRYIRRRSQYSQKLDVAFQVDVSKLEASAASTVQRYRFASTEDLQKELSYIVAEKAHRFDSRWW